MALPGGSSALYFVVASRFFNLESQFLLFLAFSHTHTFDSSLLLGRKWPLAKKTVVITQTTSRKLQTVNRKVKLLVLTAKKWPYWKIHSFSYVQNEPRNSLIQEIIFIFNYSCCFSRSHSLKTATQTEIVRHDRVTRQLEFPEFCAMGIPLRAHP